MGILVSSPKPSFKMNFRLPNMTLINIEKVIRNVIEYFLSKLKMNMALTPNS